MSPLRGSTKRQAPSQCAAENKKQVQKTSRPRKSKQNEVKEQEEVCCQPSAAALSIKKFLSPSHKQEIDVDMECPDEKRELVDQHDNNQVLLICCDDDEREKKDEDKDEHEHAERKNTKDEKIIDDANADTTQNQEAQMASIAKTIDGSSVVVVPSIDEAYEMTVAGDFENERLKAFFRGMGGDS